MANEEKEAKRTTISQLGEMRVFTPLSYVSVAVLCMAFGAYWNQTHHQQPKPQFGPMAPRIEKRFQAIETEMQELTKEVVKLKQDLNRRK